MVLGESGVWFVIANASETILSKMVFGGYAFVIAGTYFVVCANGITLDASTDARGKQDRRVMTASRVYGCYGFRIFG
jgi:hypothetical protein